jgi:hypothetical protein
LALGVAGMTAAAVTILIMSAPLKDDVAWLIYVADQTLRGHTLYFDIVEINPPLIVLLSMAPARLGPLIGTTTGTAYILLVSAALIAIGTFVGSILRRSLDAVNGRSFVIATVIAALFLLPGRDFGERDHLVVALLVPWLALISVRASGAYPSRGSMLSVGALGSLAIGLKPHYALVLLAVEAWALRRGVKGRRSEIVVLAVGLALYAVFVLWQFPEYLTEALPLAFVYYDAGNVSVLRLLLNAREIVPSLCIVLLLAALGRRWLKEPLIAVLLLASLASVLLYFVQFKGWSYHRLTADTLIVLLCLSWLYRAMIDDRLSSRLASRWAVLGTALSLGMLCALAVERQRVTVDRAWHVADSAEAWLTRLVHRTEAQSLMAFSDRLEPFFPVVNDTGIQWASRYASMWALKGELNRGTPRARAWQGSGHVLMDVVEDFVRAQPTLVVVDESAELEYVQKLTENPRFREAWTHYRQIDVSHGLRAFLRDRP